jgi:hypothetical protein
MYLADLQSLGEIATTGGKPLSATMAEQQVHATIVRGTAR